MDKLVTTTETIDPIFLFISGICLALLLGITMAMVWFVIRYHRSRSPEPTSHSEGNLWLEIVWTALPTLLVLAMFYYGWAGYLALRNVPKGALEITATASMWSWSFTYPNDRTSTKLYVPAGKPVKVNLVSRDVIHGFYIPAFRVKRDVVPGMTNHVWFVAPKPDSHDLFCSQYCGTGHSAMITTVVALPEEEFARWVVKPPAQEPLDARTLLEKHGCLGCHSLDGKPGVGPTFKGMWGRRVTVVSGGTERSITTDAPYLRRSITDPKVDVVKGFGPIMPEYAHLPEREVTVLVEFFKEMR